MNRFQVLIICCTILCLQVSALGRVKDRHNLFEPIYALDDIDVQSVANLARTASNRQTSPTASSSDFPSTRITQVTSGTTSDNLGSVSLETLRQVAKREQQLAQKTTTLAQSPTLRLVTPVSLTPEPVVATSRTQKREETSHHWSALENYYQKLRNTYQQPQPVYQILQQEVDEPGLSGYRNLQGGSSYGAPYNFAAQTAMPQSAKTQAFLLPIANSEVASTDPDFGLAVAGHQSSPATSRFGGIGGGSIILADRQNTQPTPNQFVYVNSAATSNQPLANVEGGKVKYLEWRKLPELLLIQQQQQRAKHQQETFGSWYDRQRSQELLQEEAYCGPRNYINFHVVPNSAAQRQAGSAKTTTNTTFTYSPRQLSRLQVQLASGGNAQSLDVPVTLSAGEYPSHMGVYNGSSPGEDNFLCAATWIHEQFALTLASCVLSMKPNELIVQAGEWKLNQNTSTDADKFQVTRRVEQIYIFPKYQNNSVDHNLALLRFDKPIEYPFTPYISPACQIHSRTSIKTSSCWAPVRNISISEYFDAEGEGETKEKKTVNMIEQPVRLIANDDNECFKQTKVEFFNFQHPNYICSADYRTSLWRAKLNRTNNFGSGIYCNEGGNLSLVSIIHPISSNSSSAYGYIDLSYYKPWMRNVISGRAF